MNHNDYSHDLLFVHDRATLPTPELLRSIQFCCPPEVPSVQAFQLRALRKLQDYHPKDLKVLAAVADVKFRCGDGKDALRDLQLARGWTSTSEASATDAAELFANMGAAPSQGRPAAGKRAGSLESHGCYLGLLSATYPE